MQGRGRFLNRKDAGQALSRLLKDFAGEDVIVLALPRGGVPLGRIVADTLKAPLDLALVRKIGAPGQSELAVGALADGAAPTLVINEEIAELTGADESYLRREEQRELKEIERRRKRYLGDRPKPDLQGKTVILVDDGIATGATMRAGVLAAKNAGAAKTIVAAPVAAPDSISELARDADEVIVILRPDFLGGISAFYDDFHQLGDEEVVDLLKG